jgi:hypothetical protein
MQTISAQLTLSRITDDKSLFTLSILLQRCFRATNSCSEDKMHDAVDYFTASPSVQNLQN